MLGGLIRAGYPIGPWAPQFMMPSPVSAFAVGTVHERPVLAVGVADRVSSWDQRAGAPVHPPIDYEPRDGRVTALALGAPAGRPVLAVGLHTGTVDLVDAQTGRRLRRLLAYSRAEPGPEVSIGRLRFAAVAGRARLFCVSRSDEVRMWDVTDPSLIPPPVVVQATGVGDIHVVDRQGQDQLLTIGRTGLRLWSLAEGRQVAVLPHSEDCGHPGAVGSVAGRTLVASPVRGTGSVRLWELESGRRLGRDLKLHHPDDGLWVREIRSMEFVPVQGRTVLVARSAGGKLHLWDPARPRRARRPILFEVGGGQMIATPVDGRALVVFPRLWDEDSSVLTVCELTALPWFSQQTMPDGRFAPGGFDLPDDGVASIADAEAPPDE